MRGETLPLEGVQRMILSSAALMLAIPDLQISGHQCVELKSP
jgi:hypothetical protein